MAARLILRSRTIARDKPHFAVAQLHGQHAQVLAAAGAGHANTIAAVEAGAVHGADQQFILEQELARRVVQPTAGVGADVEPGAHGVATLSIAVAQPSGIASSRHSREVGKTVSIGTCLAGRMASWCRA